MRATSRLALLVGVLVLLLVLLIPAVVLGAEPIRVTMTQQNNSGQSGIATITEKSSTQVEVRIEIAPGATGVAQPAHIHKGTCTTLNPAPFIPLSPVVNGTSTTVITATLASLTAEPLAINVHKSAAEASVYVSCGNISVTALPKAGEGVAPMAIGLLVLVGIGLLIASLILRRSLV